MRGRPREGMPPGRYLVWYDRRAENRRFKRLYVRHGEPWKLAEDQRLLRLVDQHSAELAGWPLWNVIGDAMHRTGPACATRYQTLKTALKRGVRNGQGAGKIAACPGSVITTRSAPSRVTCPTLPAWTSAISTPARRNSSRATPT